METGKISASYTITTDDVGVLQTVGYNLAKGAISYIAKFIFACWIIVLLVEAIANVFGFGTDDCDVDTWHRCGVKIVTDHKTGVQYLMSREGGLVRRAPKDSEVRNDEED